MLASQILLSIVIFFIFIKTLFSFKKEKFIDKPFYWVWLSFWILILILINFTEILSRLAKLLGIGRGVDLAVYSSIILIFYLLFISFIKIKKIEKDITKIVREIAIKKAKK